MYLILTPKHNPVEDGQQGSSYQSLFISDLKDFSEMVHDEGVIVYKIGSLTQVKGEELTQEIENV